MAGTQGQDEAAASVSMDEIRAETEETTDLTAAAIEVPPQLVAGSVGEYFRAWWVRVRGGDAGVLPVVFALAMVTIVFAVVSPNNVFLSPANLVNLFDQSAVFIVLAMAEGFVLLLGEIDLSTGYVAALGGIVAANLVQSNMGWPWWAAIAAALLVCAVIGAIDGIVITRLRLPSFVVTLAGYLLWFGVMIILLGPAGGVSITSTQSQDQEVLNGIVNSNIPPLVSWIGLVALVLVFGGFLYHRDSSRRRSGLVARPLGLTLLVIAFFAVAGVAVVGISNINRGRFLPIEGVPWVVPIVLVVLVAWTILLEQTEFGRHVYAVGGNPEAARRAGINVANVRTWAFVLCSFTAGIAGIIYSSTQGGMTTNVNGGQYVLYAVAAAVIGGTSLFGGRGRAIHGVLGGIVIGAIYNGLYLLGFPVQWQLIATGLVLLAAVVVDALSRRGADTGVLVKA